MTDTGALHRWIFGPVLGKRTGVDLSNQILTAAAFCSSLITGSILLLTLFLRLGPVPISLAGSTFGAFLLIYFLSRRQWYPSRIVWAYLGINYFIVLLDWLYIGGTSAIGLPILVALAGMLPLLLPRRSLVPGFITVAGVFLSLFLLPLLSNVQIPEHPATLLHISDTLLGAFILAGGLALLISLVMASYRQKEQEIRTLRGIIPICAYCKKIRNDEGYYEAVETYVTRHSEADFSHTCCPACVKEYFPGVEVSILE